MVYVHGRHPMPNRILREGILDSDKVERLSFHAEVFYRRLMSVVDDFGLYDARTMVLRSRLFPLRVDRVTDGEIEEWLRECVAVGLIETYEIDGRKYLQYLNLGEPRAVKSKFPKPCTHLKSSASTCAQTQADDFKCEQTQASVPPYALRLSNSPPPTPTGKNEREKEMIEAMAEQTGEDPTLAKVGKKYADAAGELLAAVPPYTPEDVRVAGRDWKTVCKYSGAEKRDRPALGDLTNAVGLLRSAGKRPKAPKKWPSIDMVRKCLAEGTPVDQEAVAHYGLNGVAS